MINMAVSREEKYVASAQVCHNIIFAKQQMIISETTMS
ncbi:Uncharacterized protein dnm_069900 [Desulfonema magnum]|uniref:Uncharacterized protein n=1 Tax=Desulfonema magnum TaxID=45655 RepID=A0A975GSC4_9BACT|nr:Uncharacterized protein dnm_069900 [Desulfonema magnum]